MEIDLLNLGIGFVIGLVLAYLTKLKSLKRLELNLKNLGVALGVEGFEEKGSDSGGVKIKDVSGGKFGDIAGRDINKNSYFYKAVQAATREALRGGSELPRLERTIRFNSRSEDEDLLTRLRITQDHKEDWFDRYINTYIESQDFQDDLKMETQRLKNLGWEVMSVRPADNIDKGLMFELIVGRKLS